MTTKMKEDLPYGWILAELGELAVYVNGRAFKPNEWESHGKPIIRIQNLNNSSAEFNFSSQVHEKKYLVKPGDLLFAWSASLGAYIWEGGEAWLNQHIFKVHPFSGVSKKFLYYVLKKVTTQLYSKTHGSGMVHVTKKKFESTNVALPPTKEQHHVVAKIEELFSKLDKGIESLKKARDQLKVYRQAVLKWAFEGKLTEEWRKTHKVEPAEKLLEKIKEEREKHYQQKIEEWKQAVKEWEASGKQGKKPAKPKKPKEPPPLTEQELAELPKLPEGWVWNRLGLMTLGVEYGTSTKSKKVGKVPVLRMGNIQDFKFVWGDLVYTDDDEEIRKYRLRNGDVLFNRTNSPELVGKTAIFRGEREAIFAGYLIRINQIPTIIDSYYLNYFLNSSIARRHGNLVKTDGVNQSNINGNKLIHYPFPYCCINEQHAVVQEIETRLSIAEKLEQTIDDSLKKAEVLRQSILKKAFEGKLLNEQEVEAVRNDPEWEPAEKLLEKIKAEKDKMKAQNKKGTRKKQMKLFS